MSDVFRANRKASDADIIRLNSVGLSLATIATALNCHPTTITLRLKSLKIAPADTRRTFMEDVFLSLDIKQQEWLADQLGPEMSIKEYVRTLISKEHATHSRAAKWSAGQNQGKKSNDPLSDQSNESTIVSTKSNTGLVSTGSTEPSE